jgi:hypothetical protein
MDSLTGGETGEELSAQFSLLNKEEIITKKRKNLQKLEKIYRWRYFC